MHFALLLLHRNIELTVACAELFLEAVVAGSMNNVRSSMSEYPEEQIMFVLSSNLIWTACPLCVLE